ncbi:aldehyde dehydrogenase family protein [Streptomyces griseocarneus]|uniref:aldehyde dehydrogenase family protein n=1 Tax=Streptomyces griseocarneus TaxID=51201 RepID=UPI00167C4A38|nr:aldehyde dehydrogenase [Streptomyces griseocarneus]MBZ6474958.1 aldehyde dehydrogenase [Streptomyces griseocarneus]GHG49109.1 putative aldehyde dehydrogenase [Streptomyces griseocarneus]
MLLDELAGTASSTNTAAAAKDAEGERDSTFRSYPLYIGGKDVEGDDWVYTVSGRSLLEDVFTSVSLKRALEKDPDSEAAGHPYVVGRCAIAGDAAIDLASEAAAAAAPGWAAVPLDIRMSLGTRFREELLRREDEFLEMLVAEAHPVKLARWELSCLLQIYSEESLGWYRQQMHTEFRHGGRRLIVRRQPDGVVGFNPPQNAPLPSAALAVLALMAGNAVVVRAPRSIALSTMWLLRDVVAPLLDELGAPAGTLNAVCGNPKQTLDRWVTSPLIDDIFYIGGSEQGLRFEQACVANGKKPILELAGNDGIVVWSDADVKKTAEAITEAFYGSGQICMVPNYVLAHPDVAEALIAEVKEQVKTVRPGYPEDEDVLLSPVRRSERFFALLEQAVDNGGEIVTGGRRTELDGTPSETGVFLEPTVVRVDGMEGARSYDMVRQETFFPLIPVIVAEPGSDEELLERFLHFVNSNEYGLRNSLWTASDEVIDTFVARVVNGGLLKVNDSHIGFLPYLPSHGGTGLTGGAFGEANYPILKTSHVQGVSIARDVSPREAVFGS